MLPYLYETLEESILQGFLVFIVENIKRDEASG